MANSNEIAQMFSQQNAMFMQQNQFAQSVGVPNPVMNQVGMGGSGVGAYGFGSPARGSGGGFNWGQPGMMGYGPGNSMSAGIMSGMSAAMSGGSMALGAASMFGMMGRAGALMDPFAWGGAAMNAGTRMGFGAMGAGAMGMGAMALPIAAGMAVSHGAQAFINGGQGQAQMNTMLGNQYQFFNPSSRTGAGFSRDDAKSIGDMTRQMSHLPEMMTSFEELSKVMGRLKSTGMMQGVRSAADFQSRFREAVQTIRETAKVLGTTMEEAEQFFTASRGAGFYGRASQMKNVISAQFTSGVTGASIGQVAGLQQAGADMAMSFGARRGLGAQAVTNIAQNIGLAQREGRLREGAVEDATGMQGPEAQMALAQKMFGGMMNFGRTAAGRLAMAGMMKFEGDRAVGVDEDMARRFNQGLVSVDELKRRAGGLTDKQKISYTARQSDLVASLAGQIGPGGAFGMMKGVLGEGRGEEATNLVMQRLTGMSAGEIDIAGGMQGVSGEGEQGAFARLRQRQSSLRERTDPSAVMQKIKTRLHAATMGKLEQLGANVQNSIAKSVDQFFDDVVGREISTLTEDKAKAIAQAFSGSQSQEARQMISGITKLGSGGGGGSAMSRGMSRISGTTAMSLVSTFGLAGAAIPAAQGLAGALGGSESGLARLVAGLTGGQTAGQESEAISRMFGTSDITKQGSIIDRLRKGGVAGSGAQDAIADILGSHDLTSKSGAQRMQEVTGGLEGRIKDIAKKIGVTQNLNSLGKMDEETLDSYAKRANLSSSERALLKSFSSASKNNVGGMNVFAQMAAASGMEGSFSGLLGGGNLHADRSRLSAELASAASSASGALGEAGMGMLQGGNAKTRSMLEKTIGNSEIQNALFEGDKTKARMLLAAEGLDASDKDLASLEMAARGFKSTGKSVEEAKKAIANYTDIANKMAGAEAREQIANTGAKLLANASDAGSAGEAQKRLANALAKIGQEGYSEEAAKEYQEAFSSYSQVLGGMKDGESLTRALSAGGDAAQSAYGAAQVAKRFKGKVFKNNEEAARALGVTAQDVANSGGVASGRALSQSQLDELSKKGAATRQLITAQGGAAGGGAGQQTEQQQMLSAIKTLNDNQSKIATLLATLSNDPDIKKKLDTVLASSNENASADKNGNTNPSQTK